MIPTGCVLCPTGICDKYKTECRGSYHDKRICPVWAEAFAMEYYYTEKLRSETNKCNQGNIKIGY